MSFNTVTSLVVSHDSVLIWDILHIASMITEITLTMAETESWSLMNIYHRLLTLFHHYAQITKYEVVHE